MYYTPKQPTGWLKLNCPTANLSTLVPFWCSYFVQCLNQNKKNQMAWIPHNCEKAHHTHEELKPCMGRGLTQQNTCNHLIGLNGKGQAGWRKSNPSNTYISWWLPTIYQHGQFQKTQQNVSRLHSAPSSLVTRKSPDFWTGQCVLLLTVYIYLFDRFHAFVRDLVNQLFYQTNTRTNETCSYMWPTSPWTSKEGQSCKKATSVSSETIQHSAERAARGAGALSWKHILSSHICLFLCQMHLCWGHLHVTESCISLCKVNQFPTLLCKDNQSDGLIPGSDQEICALHRSLKCKYWMTF